MSIVYWLFSIENRPRTMGGMAQAAKIVKVFVMEELGPDGNVDTDKLASLATNGDGIAGLFLEYVKTLEPGTVITAEMVTKFLEEVNA
jgi:hypothetical protein